MRVASGRVSSVAAWLSPLPQAAKGGSIRPADRPMDQRSTSRRLGFAGTVAGASGSPAPCCSRVFMPVPSGQVYGVGGQDDRVLGSPPAGCAAVVAPGKDGGAVAGQYMTGSGGQVGDRRHAGNLHRLRRRMRLRQTDLTQPIPAPGKDFALLR